MTPKAMLTVIPAMISEDKPPDDLRSVLGRDAVVDVELGAS